MSRKRYSGRSFSFEKLLACFGALGALYPKTKAAIAVNGETKEGDEGLQLLRNTPSSFSSAKFRFHNAAEAVEIDFREIWDLFVVEITGLSKNGEDSAHEIIRGTLGLLPPTEEELESQASLYAINQRVLKVQRLLENLPAALAASRQPHSLRCFVSFRFDEHSKALALELRNFMELAGFKFISGLGYEPRSVSAKVLERLTGKLDLFVVIFASGADSAWLHQEIGVAKGRGLPIMVLREDGAQFDEGLLSDIEYASFPKGQISGAFIPVLQAIQYIRLKSKIS
jgi:hypothetical protein